MFGFGSPTSSAWIVRIATRNFGRYPRQLLYIADIDVRRLIYVCMRKVGVYSQVISGRKTLHPTIERVYRRSVPIRKIAQRHRTSSSSSCRWKIIDTQLDCRTWDCVGDIGCRSHDPISRHRFSCGRRPCRSPTKSALGDKAGFRCRSSRQSRSHHPPRWLANRSRTSRAYWRVVSLRSALPRPPR